MSNYFVKGLGYFLEGIWYTEFEIYKNQQLGMRKSAQESISDSKQLNLGVFPTKFEIGK